MSVGDDGHGLTTPIRPIGLVQYVFEQPTPPLERQKGRLFDRVFT